MSRKADIERLIERHNRHLQVLREQQASFGLHTPAHILTEIQDTEEKIKKLQKTLGTPEKIENRGKLSTPDDLGSRSAPKISSWLVALTGLLMIGACVTAFFVRGIDGLFTAGKPTDIPPLDPTTASPSSLPPKPLPSITPTLALTNTAITVTPTPAPTLRATDNMLMVFVRQGEFIMGTDQPMPLPNPKREVTITHDFWIDKTEVSSRQFFDFLNDQPCEVLQEQDTLWFVSTSSGNFIEKVKDCEYKLKSGGVHAVNHVTWYGAVAYCAWVGGRLPTEEEWEYAARGPESYLYPWGNEFDGRRANMCDINCNSVTRRNEDYDDGVGFVAPAQSFFEGSSNGASWVGALNMLGNLYEWTAGDDTPKDKAVLRGGSWLHNNLIEFSTTNRWQADRDFGYSSTGFRCVVDTNANQ